jgi:hypothetical protein
MQKIIYLSVLCCLAFAACQKVIPIDLNSVAAQYVIEAPLYSGTNDFVVQISKTSNYFGAETSPTVNDAVVTLTKTGAAPLILTNIGNGKYRAARYPATTNANYQLSVKIGDKTYEASTFMNKIVVLDSVETEVQKGFGLEKDSFNIFCIFNDPVNESNYYRIKSVVNGKDQNIEDRNLTVFDDRFSTQRIRIPIFANSYSLRDTVEVELLSLDKKMFDYFNTLSLIVGANSGGTAAPANPTNNWSGNILGYFGAFSSSKKTIIVR